MRWVLFGATMGAFALSFTRHGASAMAVWLALGLLGLVATALAFADARIQAGARSESLSAYDLQRLRKGEPPTGH